MVKKLKLHYLWIIVVILICILLYWYLYYYNQRIISSTQSLKEPDPEQDTIIKSITNQYLWDLPDLSKNIDKCKHKKRDKIIEENGEKYVLDQNGKKYKVFEDSSGNPYIIDSEMRLCKHGRLKPIKHSKECIDNINKRGYLTLNDFTGLNNKEGYVGGWNPGYGCINGGYNCPTCPPNYTLVGAGAGSGMYSGGPFLNTAGCYPNSTSGTQPGNNVGIHFQCPQNCWQVRLHTSCATDVDDCPAVTIALQATNSYSIDLSTPGGYSANIPEITQGTNGGSFLIQCSASGQYFPNGGTDYSNSMYYGNGGAWSGINDCLADQRTQVTNMCQIATSNLNTYKNNLVNYTTTSQAINAASAYGDLNGGWWSTTGGDGAWIANNNTHYYLDGTVNILDELQNAYNTCNTQNTLILEQAINDCANPNTLIDSSGMAACGLNGPLANRNSVCSNALTYATNALDASNATAIQNWLGFTGNTTIPTYTLYNIQTAISAQTFNCSTVYNDCNNMNSLLDQSGLEKCVGAQLSNAYNTCQSAISDASGYGDAAGYNVTYNLWLDTSNNKLIGNGNYNSNTLGSIQTTLTEVQAQCEKQKAMYNIWAADEDEARREPCVPELPVVSQADIDINNAANEWTATAMDYLQSLEQRVAIIQLYAQNYPNILTLDPTNVQFIPPVGNPIFTITNVNSQTQGVAPTQAIKIKMPSGAPGIQGPQGAPGSQGLQGSSGNIGPIGSPGQYEIPEQYYKAFSNQ